MTTIYSFKAAFTKLGISYGPTPAPTCTVIDTVNNVLANAQPVTTLSNMVGVCLYSYTGSDGLDLIGKFSTTDVLADTADLFSYTPSILMEIKDKTDNLPTDPADQSLLMAAIAGISVNIAVSETDALAVASGVLSITSYAQLAQSVTSTTTEDLSAATKLWLAIKDSKSETDAQSLVFVEKTGGLTVLAKAAHATIADGSLVVSGVSGAWVIALEINASASGALHNLSGSGKFAEIKALVGGDVIVLWSGLCTISKGVIREIS